jgi:hypothetical protein
MDKREIKNKIQEILNSYRCNNKSFRMNGACFLIRNNKINIWCPKIKMYIYHDLGSFCDQELDSILTIIEKELL